MPRDGSGIYTTPPGTTAVADTTIESSKYNANVNDVAADLNAPRPIVAGGTGATSATAARANLNVEIEGQQVVNFDTHVFEGGSFWCDITATAGPVAGQYFVGYAARLNDSPDWTFIEAYSLTDDKCYTRRKSGGFWSSWQERAPALTDMDARYVNVTGDTMTGSLTVGSGNIMINGGSLTAASTVTANAKNSLFGTAAGPNLAPAPTDANIKLYDIGGGNWNGMGADSSGNLWFRTGNIGTPDARMVIQAVDGAITINSGKINLNNTTGTTSALNLMTGGNVRANFSVDVASSYTYFDFYGTTFYRDVVNGYATRMQLSGLGLVLNTPLTVITAADATQAIAAGGTGGNRFIVNGDLGAGIGTRVLCNTGNGCLWDTASGATQRWANAGNVRMTLDANGNLDNNLGLTKSNGFQCKAGMGGAYSNAFNVYWTGSAAQLWIDSSNQGNITLTSDYRIKKDVADLPSTWEAVRALRPISYTQAQYTPQIEIERRAKEAAEEALRRAAAEKEYGESEVNPYDTKPVEPALGPMFIEDDTVRWGFIAHEVQGALLPTAAEGVKDQADCVQSLNLAPIVASLTKALQEAMARIEALEGTMLVQKAAR